MDDEQRDVTNMALQQMTCCMDRWCNHESLEKSGSDHICRITRMRLGKTDNPRDKPDIRVLGWEWEHSAELMKQIENKVSSARYFVKSERMDTLWRREVHGRQIDFLKIDIDTNWRSIGLEGLLARRGFKLLTIEIDGSWGGRLHPWPFTDVDRLLWLARASGYDTFMKIPCKARSAAHGSLELGRGGGRRAAWLLPLANRSNFVPTGYMARSHKAIQDLLIIDRDLMHYERDNEASLAKLPALTASDCAEDTNFHS